MSQNVWSQNQERSVLNGKIMANTNDLQGVYVVNAQTETMTTTDASGAFSIMAKADDTLVFSSIQFKENRVLLSAADFTELNFIVKMSLLMNQLQEVIVKRYDRINAVSLGIVPTVPSTDIIVILTSLLYYPSTDSCKGFIHDFIHKKSVVDNALLIKH